MAADIVVNFKVADGQLDAGLTRVLALLQNSVGQMKTLTGNLASATGVAAARAGDQAYRYNLAALAGQQEAARGDWAQRRALMEQELELIKTHDGERSAAYENMLRQIERAEQQHDLALKQEADRSIDTARQVSRTRIDLINERVSFERQMGLISGTEAVQQHLEAANQQYEIDREALEEKKSLWGQETKERSRIDGQLQALEAKHQVDVQKLQDQTVLQQKQFWQGFTNPIGSAFDTSIRGIIQGTTTLKQAFANLAQSIVLSMASAYIKTGLDAIASELALTTTKAAGLAERDGLVVASETAQTGAVVAGEAAKNTAQEAGSAEGLLISGAAAIKEIAINAYKAAAAVYASVAEIPYVGWILAPAMAATALGAVIAFGSSIASAEGGYDIPAGVNPMTQLHQNEMVLPAPLADRVRNMTSSGGSGAGDVHLHVQAVDAKSVERLFRDNGPVLAKVLRGQHRNFSGALA